MRRITEYILLGIILIIALFPRATEVLSKNYIFGFDQGRDYLAVKSIVVDKKPTLIGSEIGAGAAGLNGIFQGPFHYYFLSIPFLLTKGDPYSGVVLMFLLGLASVIFSYFLCRKIFGPRGGLIGALFFALSPMFVAQARFTWNSNPSTLFILLAIFFTHKGIINRSNVCIFLSSFFAAFVYNFQFAVSVPLTASIIIFYIVILRLKKIKKLFFLFLGAALGYLPMFLFELRHGFMGIRGFLNYLFGSREVGATFIPSQKLLGDHLSSFFNAFMDVFPKDIFPPAALWIIVIVPAIYFFFNEKDIILKKFIGFLFLLFPIHFLVFFFFRNAIWVYYLIALNVTYIILFSYSFASVFRLKNLLPKVLYSIFILYIVFRAIPMNIRVFADDYKDYGGTAKIKGKVDAIDYIYKDANGKGFGLFIFSPPVYTYSYDYILWWYGKEKYGYLPDSDKKDTFYVLIEKDNDQLWRHKGWLETVIKTGNILWEKQLDSGFILQKRISE